MPAPARPPLPMLARAVDHLPARHELPGGAWYEPKWDGFRALAVRAPSRVVLWSRRGADLTARFPEIADAITDQIGDEVVLDGELVIWQEGRLDFAALQQRMTVAKAAISQWASTTPANLVVFDVLRMGGRDLKAEGYRTRRDVLEQLPLEPPLARTPATDSPDQALDWFEAYARAGVEGIVAKGAAQPYLSDQRAWLKYRHRRTTEAIIGAVDGTLQRPRRLVLGAWNPEGELVVVGATAALDDRAAGHVGPHLRPAGPGHPWGREVPGHLLGGLAGQRSPTQIEPVAPRTVAEVAVDTAFDRGRWRHPARFHRVRSDVDASEITLERLAAW